MTEPPSPTPWPARRAIRLRFLLGGHQDFFLHEVWPMLRHPYLLTYYVSSMALTFLVSVVFDGPDLGVTRFALLLPILVLATFIGMVTFAGWIYLVAALRRSDELLDLLISYPLALSIIAVQVTTSILWNVLLDVPAAAPAITALSLFLVYAFDETFLSLFLRERTARIVEDVRSFHGMPPARRTSPPAALQLVAGAVSFPVTTVLQIQAQGNYVRVWTDSGTHLVPGPFATLLGQLPQTLGCLVHRSEWVATRAVVSSQRQGRTTELGLSNGNTVRVASTRAGNVRDWLAQLARQPAPRHTQSSGGGDTKRQSRPAPVTTTSAIGGTAPSAPNAADTPTNT